jgi:hypothetical protein
MDDRMKKRGRPLMAERDKVVTVCITVPRHLKNDMRLLAEIQRTSVSKITARCYRRLAEFHQLEKYRIAQP